MCVRTTPLTNNLTFLNNVWHVCAVLSQADARCAETCAHLWHAAAARRIAHIYAQRARTRPLYTTHIYMYYSVGIFETEIFAR